MGEIMLYASKSVQVPQEDVDAGLTTDESSAMGDLLTILHSKERPQSAAVAVEFKDHWFYIRADDLKSKLTFGRLMHCSQLQPVPYRAVNLCSLFRSAEHLDGRPTPTWQ
jgi:hypothetical protein